MNSYDVAGSIVEALEEDFNTQVSVEAAKHSVAAASVNWFDQGYEDPFRLKEYNACLVCPDQVRNDRGKALITAPVDVLFAVRGSDKKTVWTAMKIYADAICNLVEADPTLGGHVFEARFESAEFIGPSAVNGTIGLVVARLSVDTDNLLE